MADTRACTSGSSSITSTRRSTILPPVPGCRMRFALAEWRLYCYSIVVAATFKFEPWRDSGHLRSVLRPAESACASRALAGAKLPHDPGEGAGRDRFREKLVGAQGLGLLAHLLSYPGEHKHGQ